MSEAVKEAPSRFYPNVTICRFDLSRWILNAFLRHAAMGNRVLPHNGKMLRGITLYEPLYRYFFLLLKS